MYNFNDYTTHDVLGNGFIAADQFTSPTGFEGEVLGALQLLPAGPFRRRGERRASRVVHRSGGWAHSLCYFSCRLLRSHPNVYAYVIW